MAFRNICNFDRRRFKQKRLETRLNSEKLLLKAVSETPNGFCDIQI